MGRQNYNTETYTSRWFDKFSLTRALVFPSFPPSLSPLPFLMAAHAHRDMIMENPDANCEELCSTISSLPSQLSAEDMEDFFSLAQYYASRTPQSFRKVSYPLPYTHTHTHTKMHMYIDPHQYAHT